MKKYLIFNLLSLSLLVGCNYRGTETKEIYAFGTVISINMIATKSDMDNVCEIFYKYDDVCDYYDTNSELYKLNHSDHTAPYTVSNELAELINFGNTFSGNYFNINQGLLYEEWKKAIDEVRIPDTDTIEELYRKGYNTRIVVDGNTVYIGGQGYIDLGAIAKGYALNKVKEYLVDNNITIYSINAGSSSIIVGEKKNSEPYRILVKNTDTILELNNKSLGVSGIDEQNAIVDGRTIHHIVDLYTRAPSTKYSKIVVIGDNPGFCDGISTLAMNMEIEEIKDLEEGWNVKIICFNGFDILYDGRK